MSFDTIEEEGNEINSIADLGEKLFFDTRLSKDNTISCASCHKPQFAFADTVNFSKGIGHNLGLRNTPSIMNMADRSIFFYDGRAATLEHQIHFPIEDPNEMALPIKRAIGRINKDKEYKKAFAKFFKSKATSESLAVAIATYVRTLETFNTPFEDYMNDVAPGMNEAAIRGRAIFMGKKAKCFDCHFSPDFTGDEFRNIGLYDGKQFTDKGRAAITGDITDLGKFKVPGLRNVAVTAPYMHNGMFSTLAEVLEYYDDPYNFVEKPLNMDSLLIKPLGLTTEEKSDLLQFLIALTDKRFEITQNHYRKFGN